MSISLKRILNILLIVLISISAILTILFYMNVVGSSEMGEKQDKFLNLFLNWGYVLTIGATVIALVAPVLGIAEHPKGSLKSFIAILLCGLLIFISYMLSSGELLSFPGEVAGNTPPMLKLGDTCLFTTYILLVLGIISIITSEIIKLIR